jgi:transcriptional regulator GlxA family with amidase domain
MTKQRNVAVFIFDNVEVLDFAGPFEVFNVAGEVIEPAPFNTYTVAMPAGPVKARGQLSINPHFTVGNCPPPDILLIPGGLGTRPLLKDAAVLNWLKAQTLQVELLLSVCTGALLLGQAGLLANLPATTHHTTFNLLREISPTTQVKEDQRFVDAGQIITSGGISAGIDMALYVIGKFLSEEQVALVIKEMEYQWHQK